MKHSFLKIIILASLGFPISSFAQEGVYTHEVTGGADSTLGFSSKSTSAGLGAGYYYLILPKEGLQAGASTHFNYLSENSTSLSLWSTLVSLRYNLPRPDNNLLEKFFADLSIGFSMRGSSNNSAASSTTTKFVYEMGLGKRFQLSDRIAYIPRVSMRGEGSNEVRFNITILALSVFFI